MIKINTKTQTLTFKNKKYLISSAKNGLGEVEGSFCTPRGEFKVLEKIGNNLEIGAVLVARVPTGEIYSQELAKKYPKRDWILTRILWLDGIQEHNKNTKNRYIYIHGTPDEVKLGQIGSKGCIRMHNDDIIETFDEIKTGERVVIK